MRFGLVLSLAMPGVACAAPLHLVCEGQGTANRVMSTSVEAYNNSGDAAWAEASSIRPVPFEDAVHVEIAEGAPSRIRLPRAMLPALRGGKDGWFEIGSLKMSAEAISGVAQVSIVNSPRVRIDRLSGRISISGKSGSYSGECQKYDPSTAERKF